MAFLTADETERHARFLVPHASRTFLAARILVRSLLSSYAPLAPPAWRFDTNQWGRPHIANPEAPTGLVFNLSHKPTLAVCLIGCNRDLGVDVEDTTTNRSHLLEIAERFFSPFEAAALRELPATRQVQRFFELWTLKEAYIKARGMGLSLGLSGFSFTPEEGPAPVRATIRFNHDFDDQEPNSWDFRLFRPDESHLISTAIRRSSTPLTIEMRDAEELVTRTLNGCPLREAR
jgi:4'-phosphopantetheinyl transferase